MSLNTTTVWLSGTVGMALQLDDKAMRQSIAGKDGLLEVVTHSRHGTGTRTLYRVNYLGGMRLLDELRLRTDENWAQDRSWAYACERGQKRVKEALRVLRPHPTS